LKLKLKHIRQNTRAHGMRSQTQKNKNRTSCGLNIIVGKKCPCPPCPPPATHYKLKHITETEIHKQKLKHMRQNTRTHGLWNWTETH